MVSIPITAYFVYGLRRYSRLSYIFLLHLSFLLKNIVQAARRLILGVMKIRSIFVLLLLLCSGVYAQEIRYYKFSGREVRAKDSADYIRVIPAPDPGAQHQPVQEYYMNRQRKFIGMASSVGAEPVLEGQTLSFYEDGRRKSVVAYTKGKPAGTAYHYHRNGCMAKIVEYGGDGTARVVSVYDTTGTMTVAAGNGYASESDEITGIQEEGNYADGRKSGSWKGRSA